MEKIGDNTPANDRRASLKQKITGWIQLWPSRARYMPTPHEISQTTRAFGPQEKYLLGLLALIILAAFFAIGVELYIANSTTIATRGGHYREAIIGYPQFINPALAPLNVVDRDIEKLIYSSLVRYNTDGEIVPDLAETFEILEGGRTYRFKLRDNLVWEDGTPLTAQDVVFTIQLIQDPQYASPLYQNWQGIEVEQEGENRIVFKLSSSYVPFLENATVGILPRHVWQNIPATNFRNTDLNIHPIGSGPFKAEKFIKTKKNGAEFISSYTIVRNERYWDTQPFLDKIIFKFYQSEADAITAYNDHVVDGIAFLSPSNIDSIEKIDTVNLHTFQLPRYFAIFINQEQAGVLEDKRIREAMALALDREAIINDVLAGFGQIVDTPIPPNLQTYYNNDIRAIEHDREKAIRILEDANWIDQNGDGLREKIFEEGGDAIPLEFTLATLKWPELEKVALLITEQWREVGIAVSVEFHELGALQQNVIRQRDYQLLLFGEILGLLPDPFSFWHSSQKNHPGLNLALYENDDVDKLLKDAREEMDDITRRNLYRKFQEKVTEDIPALFLYDPTYIYPVRKGVRGIEPALIADPSMRFVDVVHWYVETKRTF